MAATLFFACSAATVYGQNSNTSTGTSTTTTTNTNHNGGKTVVKHKKVTHHKKVVKDNSENM